MFLFSPFSVGNAFIRSENNENKIKSERINAFPTDNSHLSCGDSGFVENKATSQSSPCSLRNMNPICKELIYLFLKYEKTIKTEQINQFPTKSYLF